MKRILLAILAAAALDARAAYTPVVYPTNAPAGEVIAPFLATNIVSDLIADAIATNAPAGETAALRAVLSDLYATVQTLPGTGEFDELAEALLEASFSNCWTRAEESAAALSNATAHATLAAVVAGISPATIGALPKPRASWTNLVRTANPVVDLAFEPDEWQVQFSTTNAAQTLVVDSASVPAGPARLVRVSGFSGVSWPTGARILGGDPATNATASVWEVGTAFGTIYARRLWDEP